MNDTSELKFSCPCCGQHLQCDPGYAGAQINCPGCQQPINVPQPSTTSPLSIAYTPRVGTTAPIAQHPPGGALPSIHTHSKSAWTKAKTAIAIGIGIIVVTGTTIVVVKEMASPKSRPSPGPGGSAIVSAKEADSANPIQPAAAPLPQTLAELNAWYAEPPAGQNAATVILQGVNAMQIVDAKQNANLPILGNLQPPDPSAPLRPAVKRALAAFLQQNQDALQFFAQSEQYDQSRYPIDFTQGSDMELPHLQGVNNGGKLCEMAAILDAANGDGKKAGDDVATALALARSLKDEPVIISQLVRNNDIWFATAALNQSVNRTTLPVESLNALAQMFRETEASDARGESFYRALVGEKVVHLALLNNREELLRLDGKGQRMTDYLSNNANVSAEQDFEQSTFQKLLAACQDPFPDRLKNFSDAVQQRASAAQSQGLLLGAAHVRELTQLGLRQARGVAHLRLALIAIALEQFRASHGNRYPDDLSELVPSDIDAPLMDPFDGKPLRYRKQGAGYVLYSIGPYLNGHGGSGTMQQELGLAVIRPPAY